MASPVALGNNAIGKLSPMGLSRGEDDRANKAGRKQGQVEVVTAWKECTFSPSSCMHPTL